ncbi:hypothetical protein LSAT2_009453 [Lamellibrachia satsuma]|nr:hypothetical protein LSAT2_009453 [Lamellibrachia satsuma]
MFKFFPSDKNIEKDPEVDEHIINYRRSQTAFAVIALVLMLLSHTFAIYAIREPRYMFKRLAAMMHLMTAGAVFISGEVFIQSVEYEEDYLRARYPRGASHQYGYSFAFAVITVVIYIAAGIVFFIYGRKRKGEKAVTEEEALENEPVIIGRT